MSYRIKILYIITGILILFSCQGKMDTESSEIVAGMNIDKKIGQMLMVGIPGSSISEESLSIIRDYIPGGIILFGYNLSDKSSTEKLNENLQRAAVEYCGIPLFISIDQEGGRVKRITDGVTQFPGNMPFGIVNNKGLMYDAARILGMQLRLIGINMNLAPVLDVNNNPGNPVINTRSFGSNAEIVSEMGAAYIRGLQKSKCISVGKHFPGHGDTDKDSHLTLPVIPYDRPRLNKIEFPPFADAIDAGVEAIMTAHISFPLILNNDSPATISKKFLTGILREEMDFKGIIITDDMEMNAISKIMDIGEAAVRSINAGSDIILISTHGETIKKISLALKDAVLNGTIPVSRIDESVKRIIEIKLRYGIMDYTDGKIHYTRIRYSDKEMRLLSEADKINAEVSSGSVYFQSGDNSSLITIYNKDFTKVFLTANEQLIKEASGDPKNSVFLNEKEFFKFLKFYGTNISQDIINSKTVLYYHIQKPDILLSQSIIEAAQKKNIKVILLSTGNPFPLRDLKNLVPILFTFSDTEESIKQMINCLKGDLKPASKINVYLGFK